MQDRVFMGYAPMADFSSASWGVLKKVDGQIVLDKAKAYNRARLILNSGCNYFRILRRGIWSISFPFDWEDPRYFDLFREYLSILHQPFQGTPPGAGADVLIEIFDGCSEEKNAAGLQWQYDKANYGKARQLIQAMFSHLGDLPWIKFGIGNEMNKAESVDFCEKVVFPEFKAAGRKPFSYGATYSADHDWVEKQKGKASLAWNDDVSFAIFKQVHGIRDKNTQDLKDTVSYWVNGCSPRLRTIWSVDGVFDGSSDCDFYEDENGRRKTRPSPAQWRSAVKYVLDYALKFETPAGLPRFGFEYLPKAVNADQCSAKGIAAISEEYMEKWGELPENYGRYPDDWVEPTPPPPEPPEPPPPPPPPEKSCYKKFIADRPFWKWQLGKFIACLVGKN